MNSDNETTEYKRAAEGLAELDKLPDAETETPTVSANTGDPEKRFRSEYHLEIPIDALVEVANKWTQQKTNADFHSIQNGRVTTGRVELLLHPGFLPDKVLITWELEK